MYKIVWSNEAVSELEESISWYAERSTVVVKNFQAEIISARNQLESRPNSYLKINATYREIHFKKYPFTLVFRVNDEKKEVLITSVFHQSRNPKNKF